MPDLSSAYYCASDRWLAEFLSRAAAEYRASPDYRRRLNAERAPLFGSHLPRLAA